jgi:lysozyme
MTRIIADVYSGDGGVDFAAYRRAGRRLIARKCTEGVGYIDPGHAEFTRQAHAHGLIVIHYHFARPDHHPNPGAEVTSFLNAVRPVMGKRDGLAWDWEVEGRLGYLGTHAYLAGARELVWKHARRDLIGYANLDYLSRYGHYATDAIRRWWVADYGPDPGKPGGTRIRWAWQYTDGRYGPEPHQVPGVTAGDLSFMPDARYLWTVYGPRRHA